MIETSARLLRLLALLQSRRDWTGPDLAARLGVSARTVRADVEKLRGLGYPVAASPGVGGGYRLGAGAALPPLLLDDEEAVAVAVSLRTAAGGTVTGIEEAAVRAQAKLQQVLPARLRQRADAIHTVTVPVPARGPTVDADALASIAAACRDHYRIRFDYRTHDGTAGIRAVEPHRLVHTGRRWYLVAWDLERHGWRTFRVDRLALQPGSGPRFAPREPPAADIAGFVQRGIDLALYRYRAAVRVFAPASEIARELPAAVLVEAVDERTCVVHAGADTPEQLALHVLMLDRDFQVEGPPELLAALRAIAKRCRVAAAGAESGL